MTTKRLGKNSLQFTRSELSAAVFMDNGVVRICNRLVWYKLTVVSVDMFLLSYSVLLMETSGSS